MAMAAILPVQATDWVSSEGTMTFRGTYRTTALAADFNNSDYLDIYYGGQLANDYPGYEWQVQSNLYYNNGDGTFTPDGVSYNGSGLDYPRHGIPGSVYNSFESIDFDNDGNLDMIALCRVSEWDVMGYGNYACKVVLMHNNGDGTFSVSDGLSTPVLNSDKRDDFLNYHSIAVGDYDRDGFTDILISAYAQDGPFVGLYHNNGNGTFTRLDSLVGEYVVNAHATRTTDFITHNGQPTRNLLQCAGNVWFVDLNNDGWLDVVVDGAESHTHAIGGNLRMVYLHNLADEDAEATFTAYVNNITSLRKAESKPVDIDGDGWFDWFTMGYDNGWTSAVLPNQWATGHVMPFGVGADNVEKIEGVEISLPGDENCRPIVFDISGNGRYDVFYNNKAQGLHEGSGDGWIFTSGNAPYNGLDTGIGIAADFNNDGLIDIFGLGYGHGPHIYYNTSAAYSPVSRSAESLEAPESVAVAVSNGKINNTWDEVSDAAARGLGYNVMVTQGEKVVSVLPANAATGFVKVGSARQTALRPGVNTYSIKGAAINPSKSFTVGVQTVNVAKGTDQSRFATVDYKAVTTGVAETVADESAAAWLSFMPGAVVLNRPDADLALIVSDITGRTVATGRTNHPVALPQGGVFIISTADGSFVEKIAR